MQPDARGLPLSTASANAVRAYDPLVAGYLTRRADAPDRLTPVLVAGPDFGEPIIPMYSGHMDDGLYRLPVSGRTSRSCALIRTRLVVLHDRAAARGGAAKQIDKV